MMPLKMLKEHIESNREDGYGFVRWGYTINNFTIIHNEHGPAYIKFYKNGQIEEESYRIHGHLHRTDGPAIIKYDELGSVINKRFFFLNEEIYEDNLFEPGFVQSIIGNISE